MQAQQLSKWNETSPQAFRDSSNSATGAPRQLPTRRTILYNLFIIFHKSWLPMDTTLPCWEFSPSLETWWCLISRYDNAVAQENLPFWVYSTRTVVAFEVLFWQNMETQKVYNFLYIATELEHVI